MKNLTFQLTEEADNCVRLFALSQGVTISQVLKGAVNKWLTDNEISSEKLKEKLVENLWEQWNKVTFLKPETLWVEFYQSKSKELSNKVPFIADEIMLELEKRLAE